MKLNVLFAAFTQLIPARTVETKDENGIPNGTKEIPARTVEVSFRTETDKEVTAKSLVQWFMTKLVPFQEIQKLNGKEAFQTSKPMTVTLQVNKRSLTNEMKFTINPDRLLKCLERNQNLVALLVKMQSAPEHGASDAVINKYLLNKPENVLLAREKKQVVEQPMIEEMVPVS